MDSVSIKKKREREHVKVERKSGGWAWDAREGIGGENGGRFD